MAERLLQIGGVDAMPPDGDTHIAKVLERGRLHEGRLVRLLGQPNQCHANASELWLMSDGEALSIDAARDNWREICAAHTRAGFYDRQWFIAGVAINYEDPRLYCAHTGARIESAYSEDEV